MEVTPIAFDSFGVRSMATLVKVSDKTILLDPGLSVSQRRFNLPPTGIELNILNLLKKKIVSLSKDVNVIIISHFHTEHYTPPFETDATSIYKEKVIFAKDRHAKCNFDQRRDGKKFELFAKKIAKDFDFVDGKTKELDNIQFRFSEPIWHGQEGTTDGYVLLTTIDYKGKRILHAPDVIGPINNAATEHIIKEDPEILILDGPETEESNVSYSYLLLKKAEENLIRILMETGTKKIILDHHLVRSLDYVKKIKGVLKIAKELNKELITAAEFCNRPINLLEAKREMIWEKEQEKYGT